MVRYHHVEYFFVSEFYRAVCLMYFVSFMLAALSFFSQINVSAYILLVEYNRIYFKSVSSHLELHMSHKHQSHRFNPYKIQQNTLNMVNHDDLEGYDNYLIQQSCSKVEVSQDNKQNQHPQTSYQQSSQNSEEDLQENEQSEQQIQWLEINEGTQLGIDKQMKVEIDSGSQNESVVEDLTNQWNCLDVLEQQPIQAEEIMNHKSIKSISQKQDLSQSSGELSEEEMNFWLQNCEQKVDDDKIKGSYRLANLSNSIKNFDQSESSESEIQQYWKIIECEHLNTNKYGYSEENMKQVSSRHIIKQIDQIQNQPTNNINKSCSVKSLATMQLINVPQPIYAQYDLFHVTYIQQIEGRIKQNSEISSKEECLPQEKQMNLCQIICNEVLERKNRIKQSQRINASNLLILGTDYLIFDLRNFVRSNLKEGTYTHFGLKCFGYFNQSEEDQGHSVKNRSEMKDYLYLPQNGQCLLQTKYSWDSHQKKMNRNGGKINILISANQEKIGVAERFIIQEAKETREIIELRSYDEFSGKITEYLAIIESKAAKLGEQWFCDTTIFIPNKKIYSKTIKNCEWNKLKMRVRLNKGTIMAELGIQIAKSSVTNCILLNQNQSREFMMGIIHQETTQINYILRICGLSPMIALMVPISRKLFAYDNVY